MSSLNLLEVDVIVNGNLETLGSGQEFALSGGVKLASNYSYIRLMHYKNEAWTLSC